MDIVPPPVSVPPVPARQWWTWALFGCLAAFFMASNLYAIFAPSDAEVDLLSSERMAAPVALKQFVVFDELSKVEGGGSFKSYQNQTLQSAIDGFEVKLDQSEEAAAWILALETVEGSTLNERALDKLQLSSDEKWSDIGLAYEGELKDASVIKGNDIPELVARWKVENPDSKQIPAGKLGIKANPYLFFGFLGWMSFIFVGGFIALITYIAMKRFGLLPAQGYQEGVTLAGFDARGGRMSIYFATFLGISLIAGLLSAFNKNFDLVALNAGVFFILICLTPVFATVPMLGDKIKWAQIIGDRSKILSKLAWGFGGYMANFPLAMGATLIVSPLSKYLPPPSHELLEMLNGSGPLSAILLFFMAAVAAPLIEEPMFRGVLFPALQRVCKSPTTAIILTGTIFAVIHPQGPLLWPALACIGMTAAVLTRQTGSLIPAILMHFLHNATVYGLNVVIR
jgi:membrane protease YdiL (CAAX protease family)